MLKQYMSRVPASKGWTGERRPEAPFPPSIRASPKDHAPFALVNTLSSCMHCHLAFDNDKQPNNSDLPKKLPPILLTLTMAYPDADMDKVSKLLKDVHQNVESFSSGNSKAREAAIEACRSLASSLETPSEAVVRLTWVEVRLE